MKDSEVFAQIQKVDEEKRLVWGRLTQEVVDRSGEMMDWATSRPEFEKWRDETLELTGGKSMGAGRAMHSDSKAVGKVVEMLFRDDEKALDIAYKVVDDGEWAKVLEGVYTGFSVGGSSFGRKWPDEKLKKWNGQPVIRYTITPSEASLADRPCVPTATFFEIQKTDGSRVSRQFKGAPMSADVAKSLYTISDFASVLQSVKYLQERVGEEAAHEGDGSPIPDSLKEWLGNGAKLLQEYVGEEVAELAAPQIDFMHVTDDDDFADLDNKAENLGDLAKGDFPGHPFRGNQYAGGGAVGAHHGASHTAHRASVRAHNGGSHSAAANYHKAAAKAHKAAGNARMAKYHTAMAANHSTHAKATNKTEGEDVNDITKALPKGFKDHMDKCNKAATEFLDAHKALVDSIGKDDMREVEPTDSAEGKKDKKDKKAEETGDIAKAVATGIAAGMADVLKAFRPTETNLASPPTFRLPSEAHRFDVAKNLGHDQKSDENDIQKRAQELADAGDFDGALRLARQKPIGNINTIGG